MMSNPNRVKGEGSFEAWWNGLVFDPWKRLRWTLCYGGDDEEMRCNVKRLMCLAWHAGRVGRVDDGRMR